MVVNEVKQSIWKRTILENKLRHMLKEKKWNPSKNDYDMDLWRYGLFQAIQKFRMFFWLRFL
jgi:hypothetical protein